jgi:hypothetical protein
MTNKLFIAKTPEGYSLSKSIEDNKDVTQWEQVLRRGNLPVLLHSLATLPEEFYKEGVNVNYGYEPAIIKIPEHQKEAINNFVRTLEKIASRKSLEKISI